MQGSKPAKGQIRLARGIGFGSLAAGIVISVLSLLLLAGCASTKPKVVVTAKPVCPVVRPVCIGKDDVLTEETAQQIEANELGRSKLCGPAPKCKSS